VFAEIGIIYTSASKGDITLDYVGENDITFLKRGFVFDADINEFLSPLDLDIVMETARWSMGDCLNADNQMARFNSTLMFLSSHGEDIFSKVRKQFVKYCRYLNSGNLTVNGKLVVLDFDASKLFTYNRCKRIFYPEHYCDLTDVTHLYKLPL